MFCPDKWIMVQQASMEEISEGGIVIPDKVREKNAPLRGKVICAGISCEYVKDGDEVIFDRTGAFHDTVIDADGSKHQYAFMLEEAVCYVSNREYEYEPISKELQQEGMGSSDPYSTEL